MMNVYFRYLHTHICLAALSLLFCITNVKAMQEPLINNQKNQKIEFGKTNEIKVNIEEKVVLEKNQLDLLSPVLNYGKISWVPIIFLYLEGDELRECNMVCKTFYHSIHAEIFLESRAKVEFERTLKNYFQKFNPQIEKIGPYEIKLIIQNDQIYFILDKFQSKQFYFPFSLTFYTPDNNKHFQAIFLPSKNIQENYSPPFEMPERHIPFNSKLLVSIFPDRLRSFVLYGGTPDDQKLVQVIYKINFENMNQIFETYSKNKYPVKRRKIRLKRKFALYWTIWGGLLALDYFLWSTAVNNLKHKYGVDHIKKEVIGIVSTIFAAFLSSFLILGLYTLVISTCTKPPNNGSDDLEE